MTDWPVKALGEVCEVVNGATPDTKVEGYWGGRHAWITPAEMGNLDSPFLSMSRRTLSDEGLASCSAALVPPRTVILSSRAPIGHLVINEVPMATNQGCKSLIPKVGLDFKFLYYYLKANVELLDSLGTGTTFKELSGTQLKTVDIPVPPLEEQKRIVALLDAVTARVAELTECYEQARTHANNLFTSAMRNALKSHQSAPLRTLDDLCEAGIVKLGRGNIISKKDIAAKPGPYPIYSSARENEGKFGEYGDYMFDEEMITWSIDGGGRLFYRPKHKFSVTNVGGTLRVLDPQTLDIQYLHRVLQNLHSQRIFDWVAKAHPSVIRKVYDAIPMPPLSEQKRVVALLDSMRAKTSEMVTAYDAKLTTAKNLRQSILEAAFAGDL